MRLNFFVAMTVWLGASAVACTSNDNMECTLNAADSGCPENQVCEHVSGDSNRMTGCFAPVELHGRVFDLASDAAIEGAHVVAVDDSGAAATNVAISDAMGNYVLRVPVTRTTDGTLTAIPTFTLRADAQDYQSFPGGLRPSLPIDSSMVMDGDAGTHFIENESTSIGLVALAAGSRGTISGAVTGDDHAGVLVVGGGSTAISDIGGNYTLFNVTPGAVTVRGFAQNLQLTPAMTTATAGAETTGVNLNPASDATATVSGSLQLVNAGGVSATSVVLVVRDTYNTNLDRGEVPRGLRLTNISGAFTFQGVPDGDYVVLASFDNDGAVRDPDPGISGTDVVTLTVPASGSRTITLAQSFKVTGALTNPSPGRDTPELISSATPTFTWDDDSSEDGYEVRVFDAFGNTVWEDLTVPPAMGSNPSVTYAGPALQPGMYYQFRATSWRNRGGMHAPISRTEELRGVFHLAR